MNRRHPVLSSTYTRAQVDKVTCAQVVAKLLTSFIDHSIWLDLVQVLDQVLAVHHSEHSIQLTGLLEVIINKEGLQCSSDRITVLQDSLDCG